jgi:hypothetical protein
MAEWFGIERSPASHWAIIGSSVEKLRGAPRRLPASFSTLYELCILPAEVIVRRRILPPLRQARKRAERV